MRTRWILPVLGLVLGVTPAWADVATLLQGSWSGEATLADGAVAPVTLDVERATDPTRSLQVRARRAGPAGALTWTGSARVEGADLVVVVAGVGLSGAVVGAPAGAPASGRWTLTADGRLVGGWSTASGLSATTETLTRRAPALPPDALHWAEGAFLDGPDRCPQLNANDPEVITRIDDDQVICVSTLSPAGRTSPAAHLDHAFSGRFRIFASNQNRTGRTLYQVVALHAPGPAVRVRVRALGSSSTGEVPYGDWHLPDEQVVKDAPGARANGPGDAAASAALRGRRVGPGEVEVPAGGDVALLVRAHPSGQERMTHADLEADGPVQGAVLYLSAPPDGPALTRALRVGRLLPRSPEDHEPTPPGGGGSLIFGRVAGVVAASTWAGRLTNDGEGRALLTAPGSWRFGWNALRGPTVERMVAPMLVRNRSSAYRSWGSYGAEVRLEVPLENPSPSSARVAVLLDSLAAPAPARALRGTFEVVVDDGGAAPVRTWVHVVQRSGVSGTTPLVEVVVPPGARRVVRLRTVFAANNQAPHALRVVVTRAAP